MYIWNQTSGAAFPAASREAATTSSTATVAAMLVIRIVSAAAAARAVARSPSGVISLWNAVGESSTGMLARLFSSVVSVTRFSLPRSMRGSRLQARETRLVRPQGDLVASAARDVVEESLSRTSRAASSKSRTVIGRGAADPGVVGWVMALSSASSASGGRQTGRLVGGEKTDQRIAVRGLVPLVLKVLGHVMSGHELVPA